MLIIFNCIHFTPNPLQAVIPMSVSSLQLWLYLLLLPGLSLACSAAPIAFEFCVELCFPVQEGTIGIWLVVWFNVAMALSFGLFQVICK